MELEWKGEGVDEKGIDKATGKVVVAVDPAFFRPAEVDLLLGDPSKAHRELGWQPKYDLRALCAEMVKEDMVEAEKELLLEKNGFKLLVPQE
jgi:GDPmannose 4,6-dehydratase